MSPSQLYAKNEINNALLPPPLKINKESHFIQKSSSSSSPQSSLSSSSTSWSTSSSSSHAMACTSNKSSPPQRHPVIIYTHSPKIIHTHPKDFMALVQKLTGLSRSEEENSENNKNNNVTSCQQEEKHELAAAAANTVVGSEDNETSSVITEDNNCCSSIGENNQVNSCFVSPIMEPPPPVNPYLANLPMFTMAPSTAKFHYQSFLNYSDSLFFSDHNNNNNMRTLDSLEAVNEFRES
ncbi:hypothetical protein AAHE18_05G208000 [Arachis hypogaea]